MTNKLFDYKNLDKYKGLDEQDQLLFDLLYPTLLRQGYITDTNEELLNSFRGAFTFKSDRAFRDHLGKLIKEGLIERELVNKAQGNGYLNIRYLYLNKYTFPKLTTYARPSNKFKAKDGELDE